MDNRYDAIVIGSGPGGLSAALCLARAGKKTLVLEQHYVPGGWCHSFYLKGQRFSPGVHYVGRIDKGKSTADLFEGLGIANDLVFFRQNVDGFEHAWIGDEKVDIPAGFGSTYYALANRFPHEAKRLKKFLRLARKVDKQIDMLPSMKGWDYITKLHRFRHLLAFGFLSLNRVVKWYIKDPLLRDAIRCQCGDHGLSPEKASFLVHCALWGHYDNGGYYPMGGGSGVIKAMTKAIKKHGGEVRVENGVKRILIEGKDKPKAIGVQLRNGECIFADTIVSNADLHKTYLEMVGKENLSRQLNKKLARTKYSVSSLILFLTVDMDVKAHGFDSGNIWWSEAIDLDKQYRKMDKVNLMSPEPFPHLFISCSTLKDPVSYNGRYHNFEVVTFIKNTLFDQFTQKQNYQSAEYQAFKNMITEKFLNNLEKVLPGIRNHVVQVELGTPKTNEFYTEASKGSVYGIEKNLRQLLFPFSSKSEIENLYLCGSSIGTQGLSSACNSGVNAAAAILRTTREELLKDRTDQNIRIYNADNSSQWPEWIFQKIRDKNMHLKLTEKKLQEGKIAKSA